MQQLAAESATALGTRRTVRDYSDRDVSFD
jgi:hypothetical protein